ncbi:hypothetical protein EI94DRAFT_1706590 [Lactarius quietus]|nr:hypothetical protein EI94DRAFT_1706590 [Lactarius quietus]
MSKYSTAGRPWLLAWSAAVVVLDPVSLPEQISLASGELSWLSNWLYSLRTPAGYILSTSRTAIVLGTAAVDTRDVSDVNSLRFESSPEKNKPKEESFWNHLSSRDLSLSELVKVRIVSPFWVGRHYEFAWTGGPQTAPLDVHLHHVVKVVNRILRQGDSDRSTSMVAAVQTVSPRFIDLTVPRKSSCVYAVFLDDLHNDSSLVFTSVLRLEAEYRKLGRRVGVAIGMGDSITLESVTSGTSIASSLSSSQAGIGIIRFAFLALQLLRRRRRALVLASVNSAFSGVSLCLKSGSRASKALMYLSSWVIQRLRAVGRDREQS